MDNEEKWVPIKGYENFYLISNLGRIQSLRKSAKNEVDILLKVKPGPKGYVMASLCDGVTKSKNWLIHRLVASHFLDNPNNFPIVHHKDSNRSNNHISNLEWATSKTNVTEHLKKRGLFLTERSNTMRLYPTLDEINKRVNISFEEIWKDIIGYEDKYKISNTGRVISLFRKDVIGRKISEKELSSQIGWSKSLTVPLCKDGIRKHMQISRLVAIHFIPNPNNYLVVNHLNGNKLDNRFTNLEWCTHSMNTKHAYDIGLKKGPHWTKSSRRKLNPEDVLNIRKQYETTGITQKELSIIYKVNLTNIQSILYRKTWSWLV